MNNRGFTLIELMIVIAVIAVFSTMAFANFNKGKSNKNLDFAVRQLTTDIRVAQNNSVNILQNGGEVPAGGYGVYLSTSANGQYIVFKDLEGSLNKNYDVGSETVSTITFPAGIEIAGMTSSGGLANANLIFTPPYGKTYLNGNNPFNDLKIDIKKTGAVCPSEDCKTVTINSEGRVNE